MKVFALTVALFVSAFCSVAVAQDGDLHILSEKMGAIEVPILETFKKISCSDLFSGETPEWLKATLPGGKAPKEWWPVCSLTALQWSRQKRPLDSAASHVENADALFKQLDTCAKPTEMREHKDYKPPTQKQLGLRLMTDREREETLQKFEKVKAHVTNICCYDGDPECRHEMNIIPVSWCQPSQKSDVPDSCITQGVRNISRAGILQFPDLTTGKWNSYMVAESDYQIELSPLVWENGAPLVGVESFAHEASHLCSSVRRKLMLKNLTHTSEVSFEWARSGPAFSQERSEANCKLTPTGKSIYSSLFRMVGASPDTIACVLESVSKATGNRFQPGACPNGCPQAHLEEAFAYWMSFYGLKREQWRVASFLRLCDALRENDHPMGADMLKCFAKSKTARSRMAAVLGCRE